MGKIDVPVVQRRGNKFMDRVCRISFLVLCGVSVLLLWNWGIS